MEKKTAYVRVIVNQYQIGSTLDVEGHTWQVEKVGDVTKEIDGQWSYGILVSRYEDKDPVPASVGSL